MPAQHHDDDDDQPLDADEALFVEASRAMDRRRDPGWSAAEEDALQAWLAADPAHRRAWNEAHAVEGLAGDVLGRQRTRGRRAAWAGLALLLLGVLFGSWWWLRAPVERDPGPVETVYRTAIGERRSVELPDGSRADLDADTRLRWVGGDRRRALVLERGRVHFDVVPDPARPFTVAALLAQVEALGTAFVVDRRRTEVAIAVAEGAVRVDRRAGPGGPPERALRLESGQEAVVGPGRFDGRAIDVTTIGVWRADRMVFHERALRSVLAELQRYHTVELVAAPDTAGLELTAILRHGPLAEQLATVAAVLDLEIVRESDARILLRHPRSP